jgi:hypothetical protein
MNCTARRWTANIAVIAAAIGCYLLLRFPPETSSFYPRCPAFQWLHVYCPGCGGTRAVAALLRGRLSEAMHWNAMVVVMLPFGVVFFALSYWRAIHTVEFRWPRVPDAFLNLALVIMAVFAVVRNLPAR